jgi:hypothetical protein
MYLLRIAVAYPDVKVRGRQLRLNPDVELEVMKKHHGLTEGILASPA